VPDQKRNAGASKESAGEKGKGGDQNHDLIVGPLRAIAISRLDNRAETGTPHQRMCGADVLKLMRLRAIAYFRRSPFNS
jgi:hypothetical protein